jgi:uncharacterized membrane protein YvbJ
MNCPHCGQQHLQFAAFCPQTGIKLQNAEAQNLTYKTQDFCVECGTPNKDGYTFCKSCGTNLQSTVVKKGSLDQLIGQSISSLQVRLKSKLQKKLSPIKQRKSLLLLKRSR